MSEWREKWLTPCTHGARKKHETFDNSWGLSLALEHCASRDLFCGGICLDRRKFFDLLEYDVGHTVLQRLGAPEGVLNAGRSMYSQLNCRYKVNKSLSEPCARTNGFAQGDSLSLQVALATISIWTRFVQQQTSPEADFHTGSFVDDCHFYSTGTIRDTVASTIAQAWQASRRYDRIAGLETNVSKTFAFSNNSQLDVQLDKRLKEFDPECDFSNISSFKLVGSVITAKGKPSTDDRANRVDRTIQKLRKIRTAPARFANRAQMAEAVFTGALFGTELQDLSVTQQDSLKSAVTALLWKGKTWYRSPAITYTHLVKPHRLLAKPAAIYHCLTLARRLLLKRADLRRLFQETWQGSVQQNGPLSRIHKAVHDLQATWSAPFLIHTHEGLELHLLAPLAKHGAA